MRIRNLFLLILLTTISSANATVSEAIILGNWCAGSEDAFHEEFLLTIENGKNAFSSWLHHHPAISGKWTLKEQTLKIYKDSGLIHVYNIEKVTSKQLILHEKGYKPEIYVREGCIYVQLPEE